VHTAEFKDVKHAVIDPPVFVLIIVRTDCGRNALEIGHFPFPVTIQSGKIAI
jgi:hypothetical protein